MKPRSEPGGAGRRNAGAASTMTGVHAFVHGCRLRSMKRARQRRKPPLKEPVQNHRGAKQLQILFQSWVLALPVS